MRGKARSHGAVSIINGIPMGKGAGLGIGLETVAEVELFEGAGPIEVEIEEDPNEDPSLAREIIKTILQKYSIPEMNGHVRINSEIPIGRGLKSSSTASNAIGLATMSALDLEISNLDIINIGVDSSLRTGISITGAFDDACASFFGGIVITDNYSRKILRNEKVMDLKILIHVPEEKIHTKNVDRERLRTVKPLIDEAFGLALRGEYWKAMSLNGLIIASSIDKPVKPAIEALATGALASGFSGTGPATAAVCMKEDVDLVYESWSKIPGKIIESVTNIKKAEVIS